MGQRIQFTPKTCPPIPLSNRKIEKITKSKVAKRSEICLLNFKATDICNGQSYKTGSSYGDQQGDGARPAGRLRRHPENSGLYYRSPLQGTGCRASQFRRFRSAPDEVACRTQPPQAGARRGNSRAGNRKVQV